jgi:hypothetical protein
MKTTKTRKKTKRVVKQKKNKTKRSTCKGGARNEFLSKLINRLLYLQDYFRNDDKKNKIVSKIYNNLIQLQQFGQVNKNIVKKYLGSEKTLTCIVDKLEKIKAKGFYKKKTILEKLSSKEDVPVPAGEELKEMYNQCCKTIFGLNKKEPVCEVLLNPDEKIDFDDKRKTLKEASAERFEKNSPNETSDVVEFQKKYCVGWRRMFNRQKCIDSESYRRIEAAKAEQPQPQPQPALIPATKINKNVEAAGVLNDEDDDEEIVNPEDVVASQSIHHYFNNYGNDDEFVLEGGRKNRKTKSQKKRRGNAKATRSKK